MVKNLLVNSGDIKDVGLIPGFGRFPGGGHGNPLQYSCQKNSMDRGVWGLQSLGSPGVGHNGSDFACTHIVMNDIRDTEITAIATQRMTVLL